MEQLNVIHSGYKRAFSLLELMTMLVVVSALAVAAVPSYQSYVRESKIAESYIHIDAIKKAQQTLFMEKGFFFPYYYSHHRVARNGKSLYARSYSEDMVPWLAEYYELLGNPIPVGSWTSFMYLGHVSQTNAAGAIVRRGAMGPYSMQFWPYEIGYAAMDTTHLYAGVRQDPDNCNARVSSDLIFNPIGRPNVDLLIIGGHANLIDEATIHENCTIVLTALWHQYGKFTSTPIIVFREQEAEDQDESSSSASSGTSTSSSSSSSSASSTDSSTSSSSSSSSAASSGMESTSSSADSKDESGADSKDESSADKGMETGEDTKDSTSESESSGEDK
jgi:hypothetical protein